MRYMFAGIATDQSGNIIASATVSVYLAGGGTQADVYTAATGGSAVHSVVSDSNGKYAFWVDDGDYDSGQHFKTVTSKTGYTDDINDNIIIYPFQFDSIQNYGSSLATMVSDIGATEKTVLIDVTPSAVNSALTIPANITLMPIDGAVIDGTATLTINGPFEGAPGCFGSSITVEFGYGTTVRPEFWGAVGDGSTDETALFVKAQNSLVNGGKVKLYGKTYVVNDLPVNSNVEIFGEGIGATKLLATTNNVFFNEGLTAASIETGYTYYDLSAISEGDSNLTFPTAAEANNFSVGDLAVVRSKTYYLDGGVNINPIFIEIVKITAVGTGTVTVEMPFQLDVSDPEIALPKSGDEWMENVSVHDMTLHCNQTANSGIRARGAYKCHWYNLHTYGTSLILGNAFTHCLAENITGEVFLRPFEIKLGSYNSVFRKCYGFSKEAVLDFPQIDVGEFSRNILVEDITLNGKGSIVPRSLIADSTSRGHNHFKNIRLNYKEAWEGIRLHPARNEDAYDYHFQDIVINAEKVTQPIQVYLNDTANKKHDILIENVEYNGTVATVTTTTETPYGYYIMGNATGYPVNLIIRNCKIPNGDVYWQDNLSAPGFQFVGNVYRNFLTNVYYIKNYRISGNIRTTEDMFRENAIVANNGFSTSSTVANNVLASYQIDPGADWFKGDKIVIRCALEFNGSNDAKYIAFADDAGVMQTFTIPTTNGDAILEGFIHMGGNTSYYVELNWQLKDTCQTLVAPRTGLDLATNGRTFELQAWVANASDAIYGRTVNMYPELYGS